MAVLATAAAEPRQTIDMSRVFDSGVEQRHPSQVSPFAPDPLPLSEQRQWLLDLRWDRGDVWLLGTERTDMPTPRETPRNMGRFALELYEGPGLIERVRFNFPLLGADPEDAGGEPPPSLSQKLRTRVGVLFPATSRGNRLELVDRGSGTRWALPWPPLDALGGAAGGEPNMGANPKPDAGSDGGPARWPSDASAGGSNRSSRSP
jgi:hypothetical protein